MLLSQKSPTTGVPASSPFALGRVAHSIERVGRVVALIGVVLPLLLIGGLKFTSVEAEALRRLINGTPWLAWLYLVFGDPGASQFLGVVEIAAALLLVASPWSPRVGVAGGVVAASTFFVTSSLLTALPAWETRLGGFPALNPLGQFLIKDVVLLGVALVVTGESLSRMLAARDRRIDEKVQR
jgi:uncharacterized membrane protein YkgB